VPGKRQPTHPKPWVRRMVEHRGRHPREKTLYWWSVHLERFANFCGKAGREASEISEVAAKEFRRMIARTGGSAAFTCEQARQPIEAPDRSVRVTLLQVRFPDFHGARGEVIRMFSQL